MLGSHPLGPVYLLDRRLVARARWVYLARIAVLLAVLAAFALVNAEVQADPSLGLIRQQAITGAACFNAIISVSLLTAFLIGPTSVAGAICQDRARGAFDLCLASDLSSREILLGKLFARLWPILGTMIAMLPVVSFATLLGGVDPAMLFGSFLVCCAVAICTSTLAAYFAVRTNRAHEALLSTYGVLFVLVALIPILAAFLQSWNVKSAVFTWALRLNPVRVAFFAGEADGLLGITASEPWGERWRCIGLLLATTAILTGWTTFRLRSLVLDKRVARHRVELTGKRIRSTPRSERDEQLLDRDPIYYRETRRRSSRLMKVFQVGLLLITGMFCAFSLASLIGNSRGDDEFFVGSSFLLTLMISLILAAISPTALSEERSRGDLEVLIASPLTASEIVGGKWRAGMRLVRRMVILPLLPALIGVVFLATRPGTVVIRQSIAQAGGATYYSE
jgi:hypothetical protein